MGMRFTIRCTSIASILMIGVLIVVSMKFAGASAHFTDLHLYWEDRCASCHNKDSADFSRKNLSIKNNELYGNYSYKSVSDFLSQNKHYIEDTYVASMNKMLLAQNASEDKFRKQCASCHDNAAEFVRNSLSRSLTGQVVTHNGKLLSEYLSKHRHLNSEDSEYFSELLLRID